jgi:hypothetical protein
MLLTELFHRSFLLEDGPPLTKGAKNVLANETLVDNIAKHLKADWSVSREDKNTFRRKSDKEIAEWFVRKLDEMERQGVGGVIYGREGQYHLWAAINYADFKDTWEDIQGIMPGALRDFTILKNRSLLQSAHIDIQEFKGPSVLARYMLHHYQETLTKIRKDAELAALTKDARSVKLVDNEDYRLYLAQNRGAACKFGKGATWCTANSHSDTNWKRYSGQERGTVGGAIIVLITNPEKSNQYQDLKIDKKYQFDGGEYGSFKDPENRDASSSVIKQAFPYLWDDLQKGLRANKQEIESPPRSEKDPDILELIAYDVEEEIRKLESKLSRYWTDKVRPTGKQSTDDKEEPDEDTTNDDEPAQAQAQVPAGQALIGNWAVWSTVRERFATIGNAGARRFNSRADAEAWIRDYNIRFPEQDLGLEAREY